jgi:threonyl-tRNA synthetase
LEEELRAELDVRDDRVSAKIRDAQLEKIPYMLIVGSKEAESGTVSVRSRQKGEEGAAPLEEFIARLKGEAEFDY